MSVFVFIGPTLAVEEARTILDATYLPPASQGDVFRVVATHGAQVIGIVDGYFQEVPSVWHKELLWAMSQGVHVLGAASMGALRAAELADFGMVGEGRIFEAYRTGVLDPYEGLFEDDDEVAVVHAPAELGYYVLSEALVDIRCTLDRASRQGVISPHVRDWLVRLGKARFYAERSYDSLLELARHDGCPAAELSRLNDWLPQGRFSQKQDDARALLARMQTGTFFDRKWATFDFHHTTVWDRLTVEALSEPEFAEIGLTSDQRAVLAELRLEPDEYLGVKEQAERTLRIGPCPTVRCLALAMLDVLQEQGRHVKLAARVQQKAALLSAAQTPRASDLSGLQTLQLLDWYFDRRLGRDLPDDMDMFAQGLGYHDRKDLVDALLQEYAFFNSTAA